MHVDTRKRKLRDRVSARLDNHRDRDADHFVSSYMRRGNIPHQVVSNLNL